MGGGADERRSEQARSRKGAQDRLRPNAFFTQVGVPLFDPAPEPAFNGLMIIALISTGETLMTVKQIVKSCEFTITCPR